MLAEQLDDAPEAGDQISPVAELSPGEGASGLIRWPGVHCRVTLYHSKFAVTPDLDCPGSAPKTSRRLDDDA